MCRNKGDNYVFFARIMPPFGLRIFREILIFLIPLILLNIFTWNYKFKHDRRSYVLNEKKTDSYSRALAPLCHALILTKYCLIV